MDKNKYKKTPCVKYGVFVLDLKSYFINNYTLVQCLLNFLLGSVHIKSKSKIKEREMVEIEIESSLS